MRPTRVVVNPKHSTLRVNVIDGRPVLRVMAPGTNNDVVYIDSGRDGQVSAIITAWLPELINGQAMAFVRGSEAKELLHDILGPIDFSISHAAMAAAA